VESAAAAARGWRWINLWATWCTPCMEEIPLLGRWQRGLGKDGVDVTLELWSVDEDEALLREALKKELPGRVRWMKNFEDLPPILEGMGIGGDAALPIHLLVDGDGMLRCVRVGAVHDEDYGAIKSILSGG
jgi:thiol-disulfide isomerase/thioredoxin